MLWLMLSLPFIYFLYKISEYKMVNGATKEKEAEKLRKQREKEQAQVLKRQRLLVVEYEKTETVKRQTNAKLSRLVDEIDALYYQIEILRDIQGKELGGDFEPSQATEKELKKLYRTDRAIFALHKRIRELEDKKEELEKLL